MEKKIFKLSALRISYQELCKRRKRYLIWNMIQFACLLPAAHVRRVLPSSAAESGK
jgi:hypothetical protein